MATEDLETDRKIAKVFGIPEEDLDHISLTAWVTTLGLVHPKPHAASPIGEETEE